MLHNTGGHLSAREIAQLTDINQFVVLDALDRFDIARKRCSFSRRTMLRKIT
jgi:hypothetical protein